VIGRVVALLLLAWALGFAAFMLLLPAPAGPVRTDAIVVPTGAPGRIDRGLALIEQGRAQRMLVTGTAPGVRRIDLVRAYGHAAAIACCVDLGGEAVDTRSNAREIAGWVRTHRYRSIRLVTSDWHARRARMELRQELDPAIDVVIDGVPSQPSLSQLLNEYHKLILRRVLIWLAPVIGDRFGSLGGAAGR
jgi:uncharacterized SAM-binding protein YcdF (DUF218 family)